MPGRVVEPEAGPGAAEAVVRLLTDLGGEIRIPMGPTLQRAAMEWSYVVRNRRRWVSQETTRREQAARSRKQLESLGAPHQLLAAARRVEVVIPYVREDVGWEARIFPWEYMLTAATAQERQHHLTVVRCLQRNAGPAAAIAPEPSPALLIESAPGELGQLVSFQTEHRLVASNLSGPSIRLVNPTRQEVEDNVRTVQPRAIHLTGVDVHQGARLISLPTLPQEPEGPTPRPPHEDGFLLRSEVGGVDVVRAQDVARLVNAALLKPALFACNAYNTAARICALAVAEGCQAAIGFQDEFEDGLAELFFAEFYELWTGPDSSLQGDTAGAFQAALNQLREKRQDLMGTGLVLWTSRPAAAPPAPPAPRAARRRGTARPAPPPPAPAAPAPAPAAAPPPLPPLVLVRQDGNARDLMGVDVRHCPSLNYSLLHNNRDLFQTFRISKYVSEQVRDVNVEVVLYAGSESFPYRASVDLVDKVTELRERIRVPLTSGLSRAVREAVHSVLYVDVSWRGQPVYRNTVRVALLDAGEWMDDDENRLWLPSFVLPRDPAVARIVDSAKGYLKVLRDDSGAGFDGYQPFDQAAPGDERAAEAAAEEVDFQVQALWSALSYDHDLTYINPPPTYTVASQRLRTPAEVLATRSGTCVDLALLLAACLEYVDIYPVIFLLEGHAFPGYWRTPAGYGDFEHANQEGLPEATASATASESENAGQRVPWQIRKGSYREVLSRVHRRHLVPLETVDLATRGSFRDACESGLDNLRSSRDFHSMVDIHLARTAKVPVTPLPLRDER